MEGEGEGAWRELPGHCLIADEADGGEALQVLHELQREGSSALVAAQAHKHTRRRPRCLVVTVGLKIHTIPTKP